MTGKPTVNSQTSDKKQQRGAAGLKSDGDDRKDADEAPPGPAPSDKQKPDAS